MVVAQEYLIIIIFFSKYFPCHNDVRQGENLYSFLFAFYPKGLEKFLSHEYVTGLKSLLVEIDKN